MNADDAVLLSKSAGIEAELLKKNNIAHLFINHDKVVGIHAVPGLEIETTPIKDGLDIQVLLRKQTQVKHPVQMCFGMLPKRGIQRINMDVVIEEHASIDVIAHCTFPNAVDVQHIMNATISIKDHASYSYFERHVHGQKSGITVVPKAKIHLGSHARYQTDFELIKGRVGVIDIDYETTCADYSTLEMNARINATHDDVVKIKEVGHLNGEHAHGVLLSRVAVRDTADASVFSELTASGAYARGHVDCKEIVQDQGTVSAIPVVKVNHPKAHITHEASLGSVDSKQLQTLMARGLSEDQAIDMIIQGLLQ